MIRKNLLKRMLAGVLAGLMAFGMAGCTKQAIGTPISPTEPITIDDPKPVVKEPVVENLTEEQREACRKALVDMAFKLVDKSTDTKSENNENAMMSPLSVALALAMTANGAKDDTLKQMAEFLGGENANLDILNAFLHEYAFNLPSSDNTKVRIANSIWYRDCAKLIVSDYFKDANHKFYNATLKPAAFDQGTVDEINQWCSDNTDKMIPKIINELSDDAMICLFNAIVFDGKWETPYEDEDVMDEFFTDAKGKELKIKMLRSIENTYLENELVTGTIKYYKDGYEFIALLPKEGVSVDAVVAGLNGEDYFALFENARYGDVITSIPEFETKDEYELPSILKDMGIVNAFQGYLADFSNMATYEDGPLFISNVIHKTYIKVDRNGTKAAAVTGVIMDYATSVGPSEMYEVNLNRPFVYVIADSETHTPVFIGMTNTIE